MERTEGWKKALGDALKYGWRYVFFGPEYVRIVVNEIEREKSQPAPRIP